MLVLLGLDFKKVITRLADFVRPLVKFRMYSGLWDTIWGGSDLSGSSSESNAILR